VLGAVIKNCGGSCCWLVKARPSANFKKRD
jgi:hypothetical protein